MARDEDPLIHRSVHLEGSWFPLVAGFSLVITGRIWCLHAGWEQAEVPGVPVIFEQFHVHLGVPGSWVCQAKHFQLHGILKICLEGRN